MKKAVLCHCRPCRVQPGQVERVVWSPHISWVVFFSFGVCGFFVLFFFQIALNICAREFSQGEAALERLLAQLLA